MEAQTGNVSNQGITLANELMLADDTMIMEVFVRPGLQNINSTIKMWFRALCIWLQEQDAAGLNIDINEFTPDKCNEIHRKMAMKTDMLEGKRKSSSNKEVKAPEKFSGKQKDWKDWRTAFSLPCCQERTK